MGRGGEAAVMASTSAAAPRRVAAFDIGFRGSAAAAAALASLPPSLARLDGHIAARVPSEAKRPPNNRNCPWDVHVGEAA